ncbi:hypothetical protein UO65_4218 [Actinokineospora spheciospongiae]|uniref:DUF3105 domain-containing protein n=1 Tax=Actinokineospora spheciospongiae TaxID=909613 RepID=W7IVM7_9PSEU|nr:DUF3105 domain-containing protein [Actinokineospora spheciospongiae]EWC60481.1 hypothetical protein UO65_4218 [Actinokineospora spheciospongiae]
MRAPRLLVPVAAACLLTACASGTPAGSAAPPTSGGAAAFAPTDAEHDPTTRIPGVLAVEYGEVEHVLATRRVAYDHAPPLGGNHDPSWAQCDGVVYDVAVRSENLVHSMEHGAVWISYNPDQVTGAARDALARRVTDQPYMVMSPYPGQDEPVSVQAWGRQLKVDSVDDPRIDRFTTATRTNPYLSPEPGASCGAIDPRLFDVDNPRPFDPAPYGPDAIPVTGS